MNFGEAVKTCFQKYFVFSGRARRSEFWWWVLFTVLASIVFGVLDVIVFSGVAEDIGPFGSLFSLATFIPSLAVTARRLHDTDRSGWWQLGYIVPLIVTAILAVLFLGSGSGGLGGIIMVIGALATLGAFILLIVWLATDGQRHDNRFGYSPKYGGQVNAFD